VVSWWRRPEARRTSTRGYGTTSGSGTAGETADRALAHTVYVPGNSPEGDSPVVGKAVKNHLATPGVWGSPVVAKGQEIEFSPSGDGFDYQINGKNLFLSREELAERFDVQCEMGEVVGKRSTREESPCFPKSPERGKLGRENWAGQVPVLGYQLGTWSNCSSLRTGAVAAWDMGLGKARLAAGIVLLSGARHGLVVVEPHLIPEMKRELEGVPIDPGTWQFINGPEDMKNLRTINIISYNRLRAPVDPGESKRITYSRRLRHRIGVLVADEGHLLRNQDTLQSKALSGVGARRRYILTGTPIGSYPRDLLLCSPSPEATPRPRSLTGCGGPTSSRGSGSRCRTPLAVSTGSGRIS
jgi:hypothetical protein